MKRTKKSVKAPLDMATASFKSVKMYIVLFPGSPQDRLLNNKEGCRESVRLWDHAENIGGSLLVAQKYLSHKKTTHYNSIIDNFNLKIEWWAAPFCPLCTTYTNSHVAYVTNGGNRYYIDEEFNKKKGLEYKILLKWNFFQIVVRYETWNTCHENEAQQRTKTQKLESNFLLYK